MRLPPIGDSYVYIETSANNFGQNVFVSFEQTDIIHLSNIIFYHNGFSTGSSQSMGRFRIPLLIDDNIWSTRCNIPKDDQYSLNGHYSV